MHPAGDCIGMYIHMYINTYTHICTYIYIYIYTTAAVDMQPAGDFIRICFGAQDPRWAVICVRVGARVYSMAPITSLPQFSLWCTMWMRHELSTHEWVTNSKHEWFMNLTFLEVGSSSCPRGARPGWDSRTLQTNESRISHMDESRSPHSWTSDLPRLSLRVHDVDESRTLSTHEWVANTKQKWITNLTFLDVGSSSTRLFGARRPRMRTLWLIHVEFVTHSL